MTKFALSIAVCCCVLFLTTVPALALSSENIIELKKAGISDPTIALIVQQKIIETAAFSIKDIVAMKKAGLDEKTIQTVIKNGSFLKNAKPIVYGPQLHRVHQASIQDIIELKKAGFSDAVIRSVISATKSPDDEAHRRAWEMLQNMDTRVYVPGGR